MTPAQKAARTARWAVTMARWRIAFETGGRMVGPRAVPATRRWQVVAFPSPRGAESTGIVDFLLVRKDHQTERGAFRRGDLLDVVLVQVKGGDARAPSPADVLRLRAVARRYHARAVLLASWRKGGQPTFQRLRPRRSGGSDWSNANLVDLLK